MKTLALLVLSILGAALGAAPASAQLAAPNRSGVTMGHIHLAARDVEAQKVFWIAAMGGKAVKNGPLELIQFPGVFIMLRKAESPAPPAGSIVDHIGFVVKDMPAALARWKAAGLEIDTTANPNGVYVHAPDGIRVEVYGDPALPEPVRMHHIHFFAADIPAIKAWYAATFGAIPGTRASVATTSSSRLFEADDLPGVNLTFSQAKQPPLPTQGRAIDHIGFEVANLEAFVAELEKKGIHIEAPIRMVAGTHLKVAFLADPWGTRIELTEGLSPDQ